MGLQVFASDLNLLDSRWRGTRSPLDSPHLTSISAWSLHIGVASLKFPPYLDSPIKVIGQTGSRDDYL